MKVGNKMENRRILLLVSCFILVLVILFCPYKNETLDGGNSVASYALTYKYVQWFHK